MRFDKDKLQEKDAAAPPDVRAIASSLVTADILDDIGQKCGLSAEQRQSLSEEVLYVLLEATTKDQLEENLKIHDGLPQSNAAQTAMLVLEQILSDEARAAILKKDLERAKARAQDTNITKEQPMSQQEKDRVAKEVRGERISFADLAQA